MAESNSVPLHRITKFAPTKIPSSGFDWKMQDYLRYSDKEPLNFADKYTLVEVGYTTNPLPVVAGWSIAIALKNAKF